MDPNKLDNIISNLNKHDFDLCIIDTPEDTSINALSGLSIADIVVVPSKPNAIDLQAIGRTIATIKKLEKSYLFVITQAVERSKLAVQAATVLSKFGIVAPTTIGNRISYAKAMNIGSSALQEDKNTKDEVIKIWQFISSKLFDSKDYGTKKIDLNIYLEKKKEDEALPNPTERVTKKELVKLITLRFQKTLADDMAEISAITSLSMNSICIQLLRRAAKTKLKEIKEGEYRK